jgi:hypothetical protein
MTETDGGSAGDSGSAGHAGSSGSSGSSGSEGTGSKYVKTCMSEGLSPAVAGPDGR